VIFLPLSATQSELQGPSPLVGGTFCSQPPQPLPQIMFSLLTGQHCHLQSGFSEKVAQSTRIHPADAWHRVEVQRVPGDIKLTHWQHRGRWGEFNPLSRSVAVHCKKGTRFLIPHLGR